jgi:hypothetical protein
MALELVITNAGRAALVAASNDGTNAVRIASVGVSPTAIAASPATAALPGEVKRINTISGAAASEDTIHVTVRDETTAVYTVRSIALYLQDGTLFAAYGQADIVAEKAAQALLLLAIDVQFADIDATTITFGDANFINPPATTETAGVVELASDAETSTGTDAQRAVTPKSLSFALNARFATWGADIWRASNDGAGSGLDADLLDGRQGSEFALLAGAAFGGNVSAPLVVGTNSEGFRVAHAAPFYSFYNAAQTVRFAYIQHTGTGNDFAFVNDRPGRIQLTSGGTSVYVGSTGLLVGANAVWHSGNFNPSSYAALAGATFTGSVGIGVAPGTPLDVRVSNGSRFHVASGLSYAGPRLFAGNAADNAFSPLEIQSDQLYFFNQAGTQIGVLSNGGALNVIGAITQNGYQVWHAGNFNPAAYMPVSGGTFTGAIAGTGATFPNGVTAGGGFFINAFTGFIKPTATLADLAFDDGDVLRYDQGTNRWDWFIGGIGTASLTATNFNAPNLTAGGHQVWHVGNLNPANYAPLSGASFTGNVTVAGTVVSSAAGGGRVNLVPGTAGNTGYVEFSDLNGTRQGYVGFVANNGPLPFVSSNGAGFSFTGGPVAVAGALSATGAITRSGHQVWDAGNDGHGSGLDADLLDGRHASDFALLADFANNLTGSGYQRLPGGLIIQWCAGGGANGGYESTQSVNFPIAFPSACLHAQVTTRLSSATTAGDAFWQLIGSPTATGVTVQRQITGSPSDNAFSWPYVLAIGF